MGTRPTAVRWEPARYLEFERERSRPCRDLVARIEVAEPHRVADLGCGPGNSTAILRGRWPRAECTAVDSSADMLATARASDPTVHWMLADLRTWRPVAPVDVLLSNAAMHWIPDHAHEFPRLLGCVAPGGALAIQMPANSTEPYQEALTRLQTRGPWRDVLPPADPDSELLSATEYYDLLAPIAREVDVWDTRYYHVLPGPEAIVEWTRGAGLRPWLAALASDVLRERFLAEYLEEVTTVYPRRADGRVVFPFLRRFLIAYREGRSNRRDRPGRVRGLASRTRARIRRTPSHRPSGSRSR